MWRLLQLWHWKSKIGWGSREEGWRRWGETSPSSDSLSTLTRCWFYLWCTQCHQHQASPSESHFSGGGGEEHDRLRGGGRTWVGCQSCWCWCWFLFLNLAKIHIFIPKCTEGGRGGRVHQFRKSSKKTFILLLPLRVFLLLIICHFCPASVIPWSFKLFLGAGGLRVGAAQITSTTSAIM